MKRKYFLIPVLAGAVMFTACKDKKEPDATGPESTQTSTDGATDGSVAIQASATPEQRAGKLGFAKHLPKSIVYYGAVYDGKGAFREFLKTPIGEFIQQRLADEEMSIDELLENEELAMQLAMYSEEYFTAYGSGTAETYELVEKLFNRLAYYGGKFGVYAADGFVREGGGFEPSGPEEILNGPLKGGPKELVKMFGDFNIPAIYQGSKVSDEDGRDMMAGMMSQVTSMFGMAEDASEEVTVKRGEYEFSGFKINGAKLAEMITDADMEEMQEVFEAEDVKAFRDSLAKKSIVALSGVVGDYVVLFIGKDESDFQLAESIADSMCANDDLAFLDKYLGKRIISVGYSDAKVPSGLNSMEPVVLDFVSSFFEGVKEGLGGAESLGDTEDVEAMLGSLSEQGRKMASMFKSADLGYVAYIEDGLKAEGFGGGNIPSMDFESAHTLASMGEGENTFMFANWTGNEAYNKMTMEYLESVAETGYLLTERVAALNIESPEFNQFKEGLAMFDKSFKSDAVELWKAIRLDLSAGLGGESAFVIDLNGALPKVPQVPSVLLKEGKMPRIGYVSTVSDRSRIQDSWKRLNTSAENILKTISEMAGEEIPMQVPMSSEKDGLKTWFVPIPFQNDDFVPSVSVSDQLFFASSSKNFSEGLADQFKNGKKVERKGGWLKVDFKVLSAYLSGWVELIDKNADEVFPGEGAADDFRENKEMIEGAIKAFSSLDSLTLHTRQEDGQTRVSLHLKAE